ncbi:type II toxin-antitoxin system ParD family antitoxin [Asticcacaulis taihuensis]|uniref:Antitoxin ParD1/3/4 n=1 Tax=Asticcacaulis taihuensis TaxID=260084 RepID=A0A1G4S159_9CAUL|nr:type II toxin-antitoxin system ParD family antitoxin [Asticcacaulis taihuensis]SCW62425.1 antitoxin ParD1/3/4 [Asticcacaulis taihuensis]
MTLNVNLTPKLEDMVRQKVAGGLYNNVSEVIRDALRLMEARDRLQFAQIEALRQDIAVGLESGPPEELDVEDIKRRGRERLRKAERRG